VTEISSFLYEHKHNIILENMVSRQILKSLIKRKCENDLLPTRPNIVIGQELRSTGNDLLIIHSNIKLWWKSMCDYRKKKLQKKTTILDISSMGQKCSSVLILRVSRKLNN